MFVSYEAKCNMNKVFQIFDNKFTASLFGGSWAMGRIVSRADVGPRSQIVSRVLYWLVNQVLTFAPWRAGSCGRNMRTRTALASGLDWSLDWNRVH